jgi:hypothetical protein
MIALPNPTSSQNMYQITYKVPYPSAGLIEEWRYQSFGTKEEAERMIEFYKSCGSPAKFA